jgi:acetyl-CoA carboxylase carboxyl transferase subunit alpha
MPALNAAGPRTPPDTPKVGGREWLGTILSRFGPVKEKASTTTTLEFEKPLLELDKRIKEVRSAPRTAPVSTD